VQQSDSVILAGTYIPDMGYETREVCYTINKAFQPNTVSPGIKGQGGIYFISVLNRVSNPLPPDGGMMDQPVDGCEGHGGIWEDLLHESLTDFSDTMVVRKTAALL
jgi:hypothetical protein